MAIWKEATSPKKEAAPMSPPPPPAPPRPRLRAGLQAHRELARLRSDLVVDLELDPPECPPR